MRVVIKIIRTKKRGIMINSLIGNFLLNIRIDIAGRSKVTIFDL